MENLIIEKFMGTKLKNFCSADLNEPLKYKEGS